jgi:short-subunit dehydrogenase
MTGWPVGARRNHAADASPIDGGSVLVTGASAGIGRELARLIAPRAGRLIITARRSDRLEELRLQLRNSSPQSQIDVVACDLAAASDRDSLVRAALADGGVDVLVNNAGLGSQGLFDQIDWIKVAQILAVDVHAVAELTHRLLPPMVQRGRGGVLNMGSGAGLHLMPGATAYVAAKHFIDGFSEALRLDLVGTGVRVTQVCPGPVNTEFDAVAGVEGLGGGPPQFVRISAASCARAAIAGFDSGQPLVFPGRLYSVLMRVAGLAPRGVERALLARASRRLRGQAARPA